MPDYTNEINELLDRRDEALAQGDAMSAQAAVNKAHALDRVSLEFESAKRDFGRVKGTPDEIFRQRCQITQRVGSVATGAPDRVEGWRLLAAMLATVGNFDGVLRATASGIKRSPQDLDLWLRRTRALIRLKQMSPAAKALRYCVDIAGKDNRVIALVTEHPVCPHCLGLLPGPHAAACIQCGKPGPGAGGAVASINVRNQSKFDVLFPTVRKVVATSMGMDEHRANNLITLKTLLKRDFGLTTMDCANVLNAMSREFGDRFDAPLFKSALVGFLDLLVADLIRATKL
ncbi:MAG: hypothetical protein IT462_03015 [Planctomycetes bacterium]|nr:hypothetical protein [Planctomycetota bacterium]